MKKRTAKKSIVLLGPCGIGKSLIARELSKKTNLPLISIDDIIQFIDLEQSDKISRKTSKQQEYAIKTFHEINSDPDLSKNLETEEGKQKTIELLAKIINDYNSTTAAIGPLENYHKILDENDIILNKCTNPIEFIITLNLLTINLVTEIEKHIKSPYILDPPGSFGWTISDKLANTYSLFSETEIKEMEEKTQNFLAKSSTVLLEPGTDFDLRNPNRKVAANNIILENFNAYHDSNLSLCISTNALFFNPENKYLQKRSWLDAEEYLEKDRLKNKSEIENILAQITTSLEELEQEI